MDDQAISEALFGALFSDVSEQDQVWERKPLLAHYTTLGTAEKVLGSGELWFSNPLFMNDYEEVRFGVQRGADLASESKAIAEAVGGQTEINTFLHHFTEYYHDFVYNKAIDTYVACFSEHAASDTDGNLAMWRGYGADGLGVALVFDTSKLRRDDAAVIMVGKVDYKSTDQRHSMLEEMIARCANTLRDLRLPPDKLWLAARALFDRILIFAIFTKHPGFSVEQEWRVVYLSGRDHENRYAQFFHYSLSDYGVEPRLRFKPEDVDSKENSGLSLHSLIDRIILGPSMASHYSRTAFQRVLQKLKHSELVDKVHASRIPYRVDRRA